MILNIIFAVLTYFKSYVHLPENFNVGRDENLFIFFQNGDKNCGVDLFCLVYLRHRVLHIISDGQRYL